MIRMHLKVVKTTVQFFSNIGFYLRVAGRGHVQRFAPTFANRRALLPHGVPSRPGSRGPYSDLRQAPELIWRTGCAFKIQITDELSYYKYLFRQTICLQPESAEKGLDGPAKSWLCA
jgi:hypothetical protein